MEYNILSVVVGTYNRRAMLSKCLDSIRVNSGGCFDIIVVDGGSTDGTLQYLDTLTNIRVVKDEGLLGQAKSLNRVFKTLRSDYVCWLSDDNIVIDNGLNKAIDILKNGMDIGMVALKVKDVTGPDIIEPYIGGIWESGILNCNQGMLPTKILHQMGGFAEEFRDYGIDIDLTTRVLLAGYKVVYTKQIAIHHYRDHDSESWITKSNREKRIKLARELYRNRYAALILSRTKSSNSGIIYYKMSEFLGLMIEKLLKYAGRILFHLFRDPKGNYRYNGFIKDLYNIYKGQYISHWDLLANFHNSYHLVQHIPINKRKNILESDLPTNRSK